MATNKMDQPPNGQEPTIHGSTLGSAAPHVAFESEKEALGQPAHTLEHVPTNKTVDDEKDVFRSHSVAALGIPDWEAKEKKIVKILDMTLLPQLWILYMFNYLVSTPGLKSLECVTDVRSIESNKYRTSTT